MTDQMPKLVQTRLPVTQILLKYKGPFFSALLIAFVEGVLIAQLSIIVASHNQGAFLTSLHHSMPALAIVMTTLFLNRFITKWGLFNVFLIALICTQFSNLAYWQFSENFAGLFVVRFASGLVLGVIFVCMDSWVSLTAPLNQRGLVLGLFGSIGAGGYMCGIAIMNFLPAGDPDLFLICNAVLLLMLLVVKNSSLATDIIGKPMQQQETSTLPDDASLDQKTALSAEGTIEASNVVGDNKLETKTNQQHVGISAMLDSFFLNRQIGLYLLLIGCSSLTVAAVAYEFMIPWAVLQTSPNAELIPMLLTSFALGALVLEGFFGWLSDKFGRVVIMLLTLAGQIFALVISSQVFVTQGIPWLWLVADIFIWRVHGWILFSQLGCCHR